GVVVDGVVDGQDRPTGVAEDDLHALGLQAPDEDVGPGQGLGGRGSRPHRLPVGLMPFIPSRGCRRFHADPSFVDEQKGPWPLRPGATNVAVPPCSREPRGSGLCARGSRGERRAGAVTGAPSRRSLLGPQGPFGPRLRGEFGGWGGPASTTRRLSEPSPDHLLLPVIAVFYRRGTLAIPPGHRSIGSKDTQGHRPCQPSQDPN